MWRQLCDPRLFVLVGRGITALNSSHPITRASLIVRHTAIILLGADKLQEPVILFWPSLSLPKKLVPFQVSTDLAALQQNGVASQDRVIKDLLYIRTLIAVTTAPSMATLLHISKWTSKFSSFGSVLTIRAKIMFSLKLGLAAGLWFWPGWISWEFILGFSWSYQHDDLSLQLVLGRISLGPMYINEWTAKDNVMQSFWLMTWLIFI